MQSNVDNYKRSARIKATISAAWAMRLPVLPQKLSFLRINLGNPVTSYFTEAGDGLARPTIGFVFTYPTFTVRIQACLTIDADRVNCAAGCFK